MISLRMYVHEAIDVRTVFVTIFQLFCEKFIIAYHFLLWDPITKYFFNKPNDFPRLQCTAIKQYTLNRLEEKPLTDCMVLRHLFEKTLSLWMTNILFQGKKTIILISYDFFSSYFKEYSKNKNKIYSHESYERLNILLYHIWYIISLSPSYLHIK